MCHLDKSYTEIADVDIAEKEIYWQTVQKQTTHNKKWMKYLERARLSISSDFFCNVHQT